MKLKQFIYEFGMSIIALFVFVGSIGFFIYKVYYIPLQEYTGVAQKLSQNYVQEEILLHKELDSTKKIAKGIENEVEIIPSLLRRINDTCKEPDVLIQSLKPNPQNPFRFELQFISDYYSFLRVLSEFEKLDITINKIEVKPMDKSLKKHQVILDIVAINGGEKLSSSAIEYLNHQIGQLNKRDPFQRFAYKSENIDRVVDLTWIYKLSGIGKINKKLMATIDKKNYFSGDTFMDMKITSITTKAVSLEKQTPNGVIVYIIKFRK